MFDVREIIERGIARLHAESNEAWFERSRAAAGSDKVPKVHVSDFDSCTRAAILSAVQAFPENPRYRPPTEEMDLYTQSVMWSGREWEKELSEILSAELGASYSTSTALTVGPFTFEMDGLINHGNTDVTVVELKDTAEYNFQVRKRLPYRHHVVQLAAYKMLYTDFVHVTNPNAVIDAVLYYNGRGQWAQFEVVFDDNFVYFDGHINNRARKGEFEYSVPERARELAEWATKGELPPRLESPFEMRFGCVRGNDKKGYYPNCKWARYCWPDMPDGPFSRNAMEEVVEW